MAVFRCPSSSLDSVPGTSSQTTAQAKPIPGAAKRLERMRAMAHLNIHGSREQSNVTGASRKLGKERTGRQRSGIDFAKKKQIEDAKRRERLRLKLKKQDFSYVFVGNLTAAADEQGLRALFSGCGSIEKVSMRSSRGTQGTMQAKTHRDRQYATVLFQRSYSVKLALSKDKSLVDGLPIVVCLSAADLPEVRDIIGKRFTQFRGRDTISGSSMRPIVEEPTQMIPSIEVGSVNPRALHRGPRAGAVNKLFGFSFPKTLM